MWLLVLQVHRGASMPVSPVPQLIVWNTYDWKVAVNFFLHCFHEAFVELWVFLELRNLGSREVSFIVDVKGPEHIARIPHPQGF